MAAPVVETRATSVTTSNQTSHTVNLPAGIVAGDLLIVAFGVDATPGVVWASGWTRLSNSDGGAAMRLVIECRQADGTEGASITVTTGTTQHAAAVAWRISGAEAIATQLPQVSSIPSVLGDSANPDPPSVTPTGGAKDYLWIAVNVADGGRASTAAPTNYINLQATDSGGTADGVGTGTAERSLNAASEDPGTFTIDAIDQWVAETIVVHPAAAGGTDLVIQDASHAHTAESQTLTQVHNLAVQEASHGHAVDQQALTQVHELAVQEATHTQAADSPALVQVHNLITADGLHAHSADNVVLEVEGDLGIASATHGHTADNLALTQLHQLLVADAGHDHTADALSLTQVHSLVIAEALQGHTADNVALVAEGDLAIADALHAHVADTLGLIQVHELVVQDASHGHLAEALALVLDLGIQDALHGHSTDNVILTQVHLLAIADALHAHTADSVLLAFWLAVTRRTTTAVSRRSTTGVARRVTTATPRR